MSTEPDFSHYEVWKNRGSGWELRAITTDNYYIDYSEFRYTGGLKAYVSYKVRAVDDYGVVSNFSDIERFAVNAIQQSRKSSGASVFGLEGIPSEFSVSQSYPNPFNAVTNMKFSLPEGSRVKIEVYDLRGRLIETLVDGDYDAGIYRVVFDGGNYSGGVYIVKVRMKSDEDGRVHCYTRKVVLLK